MAGTAGGGGHHPRVRPPSWSWLVLPALALAYAIVSIRIVAGTGHVMATYAEVSSTAAVASVTPGLSLIVMGGLAWFDRPTGWVGLVAVSAGMVWLAPLWVGWHGGPELARSLGIVVAPFLVPLLAHLTVAFPRGRPTRGGSRLLIGVSYLTAVVVGAGRALVYDPFLDPNCWSNCTDNSFLIYAAPRLARQLGSFGLCFAAVAGVLIACLAAWRLLRASAVGRSALWYVLIPAAVAGLAEAAYAGALLGDPAENPQDTLFMTIFLARAAALTLLAVGLGWAVLHTRRQRAGLARLADELGAAPPLGSLRTALAHALGDASLDVGYWLPHWQRYVDALGKPFEPPPARDRAITAIQRGGESVAMVVHDKSLYDDQRLEREIGSAARLAIDNERLRASLLAQLDGLRVSRARIVEVGDEARRRIERDLHDGAQQRLLAVSYELRLARAAAHAAGDCARTAALTVAIDEAQAALAELREIAHGIFPTILDEAGLGPALFTLADQADVPVEIGEVPDERLPHGVERAAYLVVAGAVGAAARRDTTQLYATIQHIPGMLVVAIDGVGDGQYDHVADRVGALGGQLIRQRRRLQAEIPCA